MCDGCAAARKEYRSAQYLKNKERELSKNKLWRSNNPNKMTEYRKTWVENNPDKNRVSKREWAKRNPEYNKLKEQRRRARIRNLEYEKFTEEQLLEKYGTCCHICNAEIDLSAPRRTNQTGWEKGLHIDHVVPIVCGGGTVLDNVRPSHGLCNVRKSSKPMPSPK